MKNDNKLPVKIIQAIADAALSIKYGVIQITVHDSQIVQIDKTEKIRFDHQERRPAA